MTEQEVENGNKKIELHNKFCFVKKQIPKYKKLVPLSHAIRYFIVSAIFFAIPLVLLREQEYIPFTSDLAQLKEIKRRSDIATAESERESESDEMKKYKAEEELGEHFLTGLPLEEIRIRRGMAKVEAKRKLDEIKKIIQEQEKKIMEEKNK